MSEIITSTAPPKGNLVDFFRDRKALAVVLAAVLVLALAAGAWFVIRGESPAVTATDSSVGPVSQAAQQAPPVNSADASSQQLDKDLQNVNSQISGLDGNLNETEGAINDQQTDLSTN